MSNSDADLQVILQGIEELKARWTEARQVLQEKERIIKELRLQLQEATDEYKEVLRQEARLQRSLAEARTENDRLRQKLFSSRQSIRALKEIP